MAEMLCRFIHTGEFELIDQKITANDFVDLKILAQIFEMPTEIHIIINNYAANNWQFFVASDINIIPILYLHFRNLHNHLIKYLNDNHNVITKEMFDWEILELLDTNKLIEVYIKFGAYERLNDLSTDFSNVPSLIDKYYNSTTKIFTLKQLSLLKSSHCIISNDIPLHTNNSRVLQMTSFVPFIAKHYTMVGTIHGKSNQFKSIFIKPLISIQKTDKLFINNSEYTVKCIFWKTDEVDEALVGESFSIGIVEDIELPYNGTSVYKVEYFG